MSDFHESQSANILCVEDEPETPPPPYNLEDSNPYHTSLLHNPELTEIDTSVPYQVRGSLSSCSPPQIIQAL